MTAPTPAALEAALRDALAPRYLLVRVLGSGGMGSVYLAREPALKRLVAVKVLAPTLAVDETARARFQREAQAVAGISHPNVVSIYAVGDLADGTPYFVMQYVGGESLAARLEREGPIAPSESRRLLGQIASALATAHAKGIIHRDIKPANVLYDEESGRALVTDFGIAAVLPTSGADAPTNLTATGLAIGTPKYMSPEQLLAERVTDRTDIYSLGLLAYEILTGAGPFKINSPREAIAAHLRDTPRRLSETTPDIDHELESLVSACLRKDPEQRPAAAELAQRLGASEAVLEWPPPGLDALLGSASRLTRSLALANLLFAGPVLVMLGLGTGLAKTAFVMVLFALAATSAGGAVFMAVAARRVVRVGAAMTRAVRSGYGWRTVVEVVTDPRRDTGALIAGTREYAALSAAERDRYRSARIGAAFARVLAAASAGPLLIMLFIFGPRGEGMATPVIVILTVVALTLAGAWLGSRETRALRGARARGRRQTVAGAGAQLARAWYESFESARRGQQLDSGPRSRPLLGLVTSLILTLALVGGAVVTLPMLVVPIVARIYWQPLKYDNTLDKVRIAAVTRPLRLPADSTITALEAGHAMAILRGVPDVGMFRKVPGNPIAGPDWFPDGGGPFGDVNALMRGDSLLIRAVHGFTPAERSYLERVAANPAFATVHTLARAGRLDHVGAIYALPFPDSATALDVPVAPYGKLKQAAYANVARAAWLVSVGRRQEAEAAIRETITLGFVIADNGTNLLDVLIGVVMTGIGRGAMMTFYDVTGRPAEARALRAARDSVLGRLEGVDSARAASAMLPDIPALRRQLIGQVRDPSLIRGLRWSALYNLMYAQCTDLQELVMGPDDDVRATVDAARHALVQYPSDAAMFDLTVTNANHFPRHLQPNARAAFVARMAEWDAALLRNDRIAGCLGPVIQQMFTPKNQ